MTTLFTQLGNDLAQIITGVEMRRRARRNWMERLMIEQGDSHDSAESSVAPKPHRDWNARSKKMAQPVVQLHSDDKQLQG